MVYTAASGADGGHYFDTGLATDRWVYYSLFVFGTADQLWIRSGNQMAYSVANYGGGKRMYDLLPRAVRPAVPYTTELGVSLTGAPASVSPLAAFMGVLGYQFDLLRNMSNSLLDLHDSRNVNYEAVPLLMDELGVPAETLIAPKNYRRFLMNAVHFFNTKGSRASVRGVVTTVTDYDCSILLGANWLWNSDFSDFVGSVETWGAGAVNCTVARVAAGTGLNGLPTPPAARMTATATGVISTSFLTPGTAVALGLPVHNGSQYTASVDLTGYVASEHTATLSIRWYDLSGTVLSTSAGTAVTLRQMEAEHLTVTATAPTNAMYAGLVVSVTTAVTAGSNWDIARAQFSPGATEYPHESGRDVRVVLHPTTVYEVGSYPPSPDTLVTTGEYIWEGTPDSSALLYYPRRGAVDQRIREILPRYLPFGATFTIVYSRTDAPYVADNDTVLGVGGAYPAVTPIGVSLSVKWQQALSQAVALNVQWNDSDVPSDPHGYQGSYPGGY